MVPGWILVERQWCKSQTRNSNVQCELRKYDCQDRLEPARSGVGNAEIVMKVGKEDVVLDIF